VATAAAFACLAVPAVLVGTPAAGDLLLGAVIFSAGAIAGDGAKARRLYATAMEQRAAQAEAQRELETREAVLAERTRLARELHDAVGHTVNVLVMHAGAGRIAAEKDLARGPAVLREIEEIGRAALTDIDRLLGLLRDGEEASREPAPGPADLPALVERLRTAGLIVDLNMPDRLPPLPQAVGSAVYRITQEALTNAFKHAGPARVSARLVVDDDRVVVTVDDDGRSGAVTPRKDARVGRGLIGMRERVAMLGGQLHAGPRPDGDGFRVHAILPIDDTSPSPAGSRS
jgi:signal transduction histidine kinase